jgi:hypothetical protein
MDKLRSGWNGRDQKTSTGSHWVKQNRQNK